MSIRPKPQGGFQGGLSGTAPGPQRAQSRTTTQRARTLGVPAGSGHIGNLQSIRSGTTRSTASTPHTCRPPREASPAPDTRAGAVHAPGPRRPSPIAHAAYPRAQAAARRTLSFTIASQTIASSPDGSEISRAASSACGTPAATVGGGCRFRASSTVTSSSSPCNNPFGHSHTRSSGRRTREDALCRQQRIPRCVLSRGGIPVE